METTKEKTEQIKVISAEIYIVCGNGESYLFHKDNEYKRYKESELADMFGMEEFHYASALDGVNCEFRSFNTYNWGAPFTFCGVMGDDVGIVNIHLGGDARGNYSKPYFCDDIHSLISQSAYLFLELSNGESFNINCDNSEAYFDIEGFDPYYFDKEKTLSKETLEAIKELDFNN